jgi:hypothetical protein
MVGARGLVLAGLLLVVGAPPLASAAVDPFAVTGVTVDATASTASVARDQALADGQRKAFRRLLERLTAPADYPKLPQLSDAEITPLVAGFQVQEERTSTIRYLATLTYSFRPNAIRALLRRAGVPFAETGSRPVLLVPVLKPPGGGVPLLWETQNTWRQVWIDKPPPTGLVPVVVPTGEPADMAALPAPPTDAAGAGALAPLLQRYDTGEAMVAEAALDAGGVTITLRSPGSSDPVFTDRLAQAGVESQTDLLRRAALRVVQALEERWKRETVVQPQDDTGASGLTVHVPLQSFADWLELRRRLASTGFVQGVQLKSLSKREALVELNFAGDANQLKLVLAQRQLALDETPDGWSLRVVGTQAGGAQTGERPPAPQ